MASFKDYIGTRVAEEDFTVEVGLLRRLSLIFRDSDATPPPAQFLPTFLLGSLGAHQAVFDLLQLKPNQILHTREIVTTIDNLVEGDQIVVRTLIHDLYEQQASSSPMGFIHAMVLGERHKKPVFKCERISAIRGGFPR